MLGQTDLSIGPGPHAATKLIKKSIDPKAVMEVMNDPKATMGPKKQDVITFDNTAGFVERLYKDGGLSTKFANKILKKVANHKADAIARSKTQPAFGMIEEEQHGEGGKGTHSSSTAVLSRSRLNQFKQGHDQADLERFSSTNEANTRQSLQLEPGPRRSLLEPAPRDKSRSLHAVKRSSSAPSPDFEFQEALKKRTTVTTLRKESLPTNSIKKDLDATGSTLGTFKGSSKPSTILEQGLHQCLTLEAIKNVEKNITEERRKESLQRHSFNQHGGHRESVQRPSFNQGGSDINDPQLNFKRNTNSIVVQNPSERKTLQARESNADKTLQPRESNAGKTLQPRESRVPVPFSIPANNREIGRGSRFMLEKAFNQRPSVIDEENPALQEFNSGLESNSVDPDLNKSASADGGRSMSSIPVAGNQLRKSMIAFRDNSSMISNDSTIFSQFKPSKGNGYRESTGSRQSNGAIPFNVEMEANNAEDTLSAARELRAFKRASTVSMMSEVWRPSDDDDDDSGASSRPALSDVNSEPSLSEPSPDKVPADEDEPRASGGEDEKEIGTGRSFYSDGIGLAGLAGSRVFAKRLLSKARASLVQKRHTVCSTAPSDSTKSPELVNVCSEGVGEGTLDQCRMLAKDLMKKISIKDDKGLNEEELQGLQSLESDLVSGPTTDQQMVEADEPLSLSNGSEVFQKMAQMRSELHIERKAMKVRLKSSASELAAEQAQTTQLAAQLAAMDQALQCQEAALAERQCAIDGLLRKECGSSNESDSGIVRDPAADEMIAQLRTALEEVVTYGREQDQRMIQLESELAQMRDADRHAQSECDAAQSPERSWLGVLTEEANEAARENDSNDESEILLERLRTRTSFSEFPSAVIVPNLDVGDVNSPSTAPLPGPVPEPTPEPTPVSDHISSAGASPKPISLSASAGASPKVSRLSGTMSEPLSSDNGFRLRPSLVALFKNALMEQTSQESTLQDTSNRENGQRLWMPEAATRPSLIAPEQFELQPQGCRASISLPGSPQKDRLAMVGLMVPDRSELGPSLHAESLPVDQGSPKPLSSQPSESRPCSRDVYEMSCKLAIFPGIKEKDVGLGKYYGTGCGNRYHAGASPPAQDLLRQGGLNGLHADSSMPFMKRSSSVPGQSRRGQEGSNSQLQQERQRLANHLRSVTGITPARASRSEFSVATSLQRQSFSSSNFTCQTSVRAPSLR